ncbi:uncharacterized protein LOC142972630 isoform X1 [Anticarsia gemmatalis]|uniref:uncharacterized protein LOC142972630 isoform X1 n=1 Tax=Anticarsia gemmatalis TaxID=129554 RepID=UPI003F76A702
MLDVRWKSSRAVTIGVGNSWRARVLVVEGCECRERRRCDVTCGRSRGTVVRGRSAAACASCASASAAQCSRQSVSDAAPRHTHGAPTSTAAPRTQHGKTTTRGGSVGMDAALVARVARGGGVDGAAGVAGLRHAGAGGGARLRAADAPRARLRLRRDSEYLRVRLGVGRAHEPRRDAGRGAVRTAARAARPRVRGGAAAGRGARLRRAGGDVAGRRDRGHRGRDAAGPRRVAAGRHGDGGGAHRHAGAGRVRRVGGARPAQPRPRRAGEARPRHRRTRLRGGSRDGRQSQPRQELRARARAGTLAAPLGVLGGAAAGRRASGAAAPLGAVAAPRCRRRRRRRGDTAQRQALTLLKCILYLL